MTQRLSSAQRLLKLYNRLFLDNKKHYQAVLAKELSCSPQTIMRLAYEIENEYPSCFHTGLDNGRRWYSLNAANKNKLGLKYQELHYLSLCQTLAKPYLSEQIVKRIDSTLFQLSTTLLEAESANLNTSTNIVSYFAKGMIDYSDYDDVLNDIITCIDNHYYCYLGYRANNKISDKHYYFAPHRLIAMNHALYVYGTLTDNHGTKEINPICLAIHRIQHLNLIRQPVSINLSQIHSHTFGLPWHEPKQIRIYFNQETANYIKERIWSQNQIVDEHHTGDITLTIETTSEKETEAWVRSFGDKAYIIKQNRT